MEDEEFLAQFKRFRILVIGRANSGKTTILRAVCGTDEEPEVYDERGREVSTWIYSRSIFHSPTRLPSSHLLLRTGSVIEVGIWVLARVSRSNEEKGIYPQPHLGRTYTRLCYPKSGARHHSYTILFLTTFSYKSIAARRT